MWIKLKTTLLNKGRVYVDAYEEYYYFTAPRYGMHLKLDKEDVLEFLKDPKDNFYFRNSYGNCINYEDKKAIVKYLRKQCNLKRYKTVSRCILYSKKDELKNSLELFTTKELYEYINK